MIGCGEDAVHDLGATVTIDRIGMEDSTVDAGMCCGHFDQLSGAVEPFVYVTVCAREADPAMHRVDELERFRAALTELADGDDAFPEDVRRIALAALEGTS